MSASTDDVINRLVGIEPFSHLAAIRAQRPETVANAQASYLALFAPADPGRLSLQERYAVATFVAELHRQSEAIAFYSTELAARHSTTAVAEAIHGAAWQSAARGPYGGDAPELPSARETGDLVYRVSEAHRRVLGPRLSAAIEHAHLLVFHPRDSEPHSHKALLDAGLSTTEIVTLSQLVGFLTYQLRVITGLRRLQTGD